VVADGRETYPFDSDEEQLRIECQRVMGNTTAIPASPTTTTVASTTIAVPVRTVSPAALVGALQQPFETPAGSHVSAVSVYPYVPATGKGTQIGGAVVDIGATVGNVVATYLVFPSPAAAASDYETARTYYSPAQPIRLNSQVSAFYFGGPDGSSRAEFVHNNTTHPDRARPARDL
jgi:hypothetical protein